MRVTNSMVLRSTMRDLQQSLGRLQDTQARISSGKDFANASDDPTRATAAFGLRRQLRRAEQRMRTMDDSVAFLRTSDVALTSALDVLEQAKTVAVQAGNTGATTDANARAAMAKEIRSIRDELVTIANARHGERSVFAGTAAGAAYSAGGAYLGDGGTVTRDVAAQTSVTVNVTGPTVFGVAGGAVGDVFEVLDRLAIAIESGNSTAMATEHGNLDAATSRVGAAAVEIGTKSARLESLRERSVDEQLGLQRMLTETEDVDLVEALVTVKAQETSYQAALQAAAMIVPPTLLDYLR